MRFNKFDLNLLVALDALLRERNVTRAAERVFVSQPAMSASLAKLREYFNDPLLVRVGRDLELTLRARSLLAPVRQMLVNANSFLFSQQAFDPSSEQRTFTLLCPDYISPWAMPGILRRLYKEAPGIRIEVERPNGSGLDGIAQLEAYLLLSLDAIESDPATNIPDSICSEFVVELKYVCVVAGDHPEVTDRLTEDQFLRLPYVIVRHGRKASRVEELVRERFGVQLDIRAVTENVLEVPFMITQGTSFIGVTLEPCARVLLDSPRMKVLSLPEGLSLRSRLDMLWHRSMYADPAHEWFRNLLLEECATYQLSKVQR